MFTWMSMILDFQCLSWLWMVGSAWSWSTCVSAGEHGEALIWLSLKSPGPSVSHQQQRRHHDVLSCILITNKQTTSVILNHIWAQICFWAGSTLLCLCVKESEYRCCITETPILKKAEWKKKEENISSYPPCCFTTSASHSAMPDSSISWMNSATEIDLHN